MRVALFGQITIVHGHPGRQAAWMNRRQLSGRDRRRIENQESDQLKLLAPSSPVAQAHDSLNRLNSNQPFTQINAHTTALTRLVQTHS